MAYKLKNHQCPNCGSPVKESGDKYVCEYCRTTFSKEKIEPHPKTNRTAEKRKYHIVHSVAGGVLITAGIIWVLLTLAFFVFEEEMFKSLSFSNIISCFVLSSPGILMIVLGKNR